MDMTAETVPKINYSRNTPLDKDEQALAEKYYSFAQMRIKGYIYKYGSYIRSGTVNADDLEADALLQYIRSIKALTVSLKSDKSFKDDNDVDLYIRAWISGSIKRSFKTSIRSAAAEKRSVFAVAYSLDEPINENADDSMERFVPMKTPSPEQETEFKLLLDLLYKVLTPAQIKACEMLMGGYDIQSIINKKIAAYSDIAYIRSYLWQLINFGYIKFRIEDCKRKNVKFDNTTGKWEVRIFFGKKIYFLSKYYDFNVAADVAERAEGHCIKGDFALWYSRHLINSAFVFPQDFDSEENPDDLPKLKNKIRHSVRYADKSNDTVSGVYYNKHRDSYDVTIGRKKLAYGLTREKAVELRLEAEEHIRNGDFEQWFEKLKEKSKQPVLTRIYYVKNNDTYAVRLKSRYIFKSKSYDKALKMKEDADMHIKAGDFDEWFKEIKTKGARE